MLYCGAYLLAFVVCSNLYFNVVKPIDINRYIIHVRGKNMYSSSTSRPFQKKPFLYTQVCLINKTYPIIFHPFGKVGGFFFNQRIDFCPECKFFFALLFKMFNLTACIMTGDI